MKELPLDVANVPCQTLELLEALLEKCLPKRIPPRLKDVIDYSLRYAYWTGGPEEVDGGQSVAQFLDDDVRYHLESDLDGGIVTIRVYEKLRAQLNSLIACLYRHRIVWR